MDLQVVRNDSQPRTSAGQPWIEIPVTEEDKPEDSQFFPRCLL